MKYPSIIFSILKFCLLLAFSSVAFAEDCPEVGGYDALNPPAATEWCTWTWVIPQPPAPAPNAPPRVVDGDDPYYDPHWESVPVVVVTAPPYFEPNDCQTADDDACDGSAPSLVDEDYYEEMDNTRPPEPPCDSLATIEVNQAQCKVDLSDAFKHASENCGAFGGTSAAVAVAAAAAGAESKNKYVKGIAYSIAGLAALSTELFGTSCPSSTQLDASRDECDLRAAKHKQGCGY